MDTQHEFQVFNSIQYLDKGEWNLHAFSWYALILLSGGKKKKKKSASQSGFQIDSPLGRS